MERTERYESFLVASDGAVTRAVAACLEKLREGINEDRSNIRVSWMDRSIYEGTGDMSRLVLQVDGSSEPIKAYVDSKALIVVTITVHDLDCRQQIGKTLRESLPKIEALSPDCEVKYRLISVID